MIFKLPQICLCELKHFYAETSNEPGQTTEAENFCVSNINHKINNYMHHYYNLYVYVIKYR